MAVCIESGNCVTLSAGPPLRADLVVSPDANNQLECRDNGAYVPAPIPCVDTADNPCTCANEAAYFCNAIQQEDEGCLWVPEICGGCELRQTVDTCIPPGSNPGIDFPDTLSQPPTTVTGNALTPGNLNWPIVVEGPAIEICNTSVCSYMNLQIDAYGGSAGYRFDNEDCRIQSFDLRFALFEMTGGLANTAGATIVDGTNVERYRGQRDGDGNPDPYEWHDEGGDIGFSPLMWCSRLAPGACVAYRTAKIYMGPINAFGNDQSAPVFTGGYGSFNPIFNDPDNLFPGRHCVASSMAVGHQKLRVQGMTTHCYWSDLPEGPAVTQVIDFPTGGGC